jgi:4-aminobutyrate aminotransferase-like enzyme
MATSSTNTEKTSHKCSQILSSNYHLPEKQYCGCVTIGNKNYYTPYYDSIDEARLELRCLEKQLSYEIVETVQEEGYYPHRAIMVEELYQKSGRTNGLYSGLNVNDGSISDDAA